MDWDVYWVHEEGVRPADSVGLHSEALLVKDGHPGCVIHHLQEDVAPDAQPLLALRRIDQRVGLCCSLVEFFVAVPRPVPAARDRATAAEDRAVKIGRVRE